MCLIYEYNAGDTNKGFTKGGRGHRSITIIDGEDCIFLCRVYYCDYMCFLMCLLQV